MTAVADRDHWRRLFNRLDAAITHHEASTAEGFRESYDDALYAARKRVLRDAATPVKGIPSMSTKSTLDTDPERSLATEENRPA